MNETRGVMCGGALKVFRLLIPSLFALASLAQWSSQASFADDQPPAGESNEPSIALALKRLSTIGDQSTESDASAMNAYSALALASAEIPQEKVDEFYARQAIPMDEEVKRSLGADLLRREVEECRRSGKPNDDCLKQAVSKMKELGGRPDILDRLVASIEQSPLETLRAMKRPEMSAEPEWPEVKLQRGSTGAGGKAGGDKPAGPTTLTLKGHTASVRNGAFTSDGRILATTSQDKSVRLWDTQTGALLRTLEGYGTGSVVFSPDGKTGASESIEDRDGRNYYAVKVWDVQTGALKHTLDLQQGPMAFSPDGNSLATIPLGNGPKGISLWDVQTGGLRQTLSQEPFLHPYSVRDVIFSPDGNLLVVGTGRQSQSGEVVLIDASTGATKSRLSGHTNIVQRVAISPDGLTLASASLDGTVRLWDLNTGQTRQTLKGDTPPLSALFSFDGKMLAAGLPAGVMMWDAQSGSEKPSVGDSWSIAIGFSPDGKTILVATKDGNDVVLKRFPVS